MSKHYILEGKEVIETDLLTWGRWIEDDHNNRVVQQTVMPDGKWVSTIFLGLDHNLHEDGPPLIFETMIFSNKKDLSELYCDRYSTYDEVALP